MSRSLRLRSWKVGGCLPGQGQCSTGDPIAGLLSRGRVRDLPGFQAIRPVPLPRSRTPAESTIPRLLTVPSMLPPLVRQRRLQRINHIGAIARLQHLLPTLQEWCCHHPCKARFRLAGSPLPGGSRTLWITTKGFRSHSRPPLLDLSWRNVRRVFPSTAGRLAFQAVPSRVVSGLSLLPAYATRRPFCIRPLCTSLSQRLSRTVSGRRLDRAPPWRSLLLRPRGPRSGPGCSVPVRIGPIRLTHGHIAISPHGGLYAMPSLCGSAEATREWFRALTDHSFLACRPL